MSDKLSISVSEGESIISDVDEKGLPLDQTIATNPKQYTDSELYPPSSRDGQIQVDSQGEQIVRSKSCCEKTASCWSTFVNRTLDYFQFDRLFNQPDKKQLQVTDDRTFKRYLDTYDETYSQRQLKFAYSFDYVLQERIKEELRKEKDICSELCRMLSCEGGTEMQELEEAYLSPREYQKVMRRKLLQRKKQLQEQAAIPKDKQYNMSETMNYQSHNNQASKNGNYYEANRKATLTTDSYILPDEMMLEDDPTQTIHLSNNRVEHKQTKLVRVHRNKKEKRAPNEPGNHNIFDNRHNELYESSVPYAQESIDLSDNTFDMAFGQQEVRSFRNIKKGQNSQHIRGHSDFVINQSELNLAKTIVIHNDEEEMEDEGPKLQKRKHKVNKKVKKSKMEPLDGQKAHISAVNNVSGKPESELESYLQRYNTNTTNNEQIKHKQLNLQGSSSKKGTPVVQEQAQIDALQNNKVRLNEDTHQKSSPVQRGTSSAEISNQRRGMGDERSSREGKKIHKPSQAQPVSQQGGVSADSSRSFSNSTASPMLDPRLLSPQMNSLDTHSVPADSFQLELPSQTKQVKTINKEIERDQLKPDENLSFDLSNIESVTESMQMSMSRANKKRKMRKNHVNETQSLEQQIVIQDIPEKPFSKPEAQLELPRQNKLIQSNSVVFQTNQEVSGEGSSAIRVSKRRRVRPAMQAEGDSQVQQMVVGEITEVEGENFMRVEKKKRNKPRPKMQDVDEQIELQL